MIEVVGGVDLGQALKVRRGGRWGLGARHGLILVAEQYNQVEEQNRTKDDHKRQT